MKRYDEYKMIVSKINGARTYNLSNEEFKAVDTDEYDVYVKCRKCGCIHKVHSNCECCDIETKLKKEGQ